MLVNKTCVFRKNRTLNACGQGKLPYLCSVKKKSRCASARDRQVNVCNEVRCNGLSEMQNDKQAVSTTISN